EILSPDQSTLELQKKILHFMSVGTQLAWLIDIQRQQIWVWQDQDLPLIYAGNERLPTLDGIEPITVTAVIEMTRNT
ncbi:MAG: Uma2 family endonuclease, partial [Cyanobacteria bacterium P01_C01_bin.69]